MVTKRWSVALALLSLLLLLVSACGGGGDKEIVTPTATPAIGTETPIATSSATVVPATTPTPASTAPIKIGVVNSWSGPAAVAGILADKIINLVEEQVKNQGGLLGGRMVKFVKGDDGGAVAGSTSAAKKLILEDKVVIMTLGGVSGAHSTAVSDVCEELKIPYAAYTTVANVQDRKYTVELYGHGPAIKANVGFLVNVLKPKTMAILAKDDEPAHIEMDGLKEGIKAAGIEVIYEQYFPLTTMDFSSYLSTIKYKNPDVLVTFLLTESAIAINKQILEQGGWGTIKHYDSSPAGSLISVIRMPAAIGTYVAVLWLPDSDEPGMKTFGDAYKQKYGSQPSTGEAFHYNSLWVAIKAIELANSDDPAEIAKALRSGNLSWDSAYGPMTIPTNGEADMTQMVALVQAGSKLVKVWPQ